MTTINQIYKCEICGNIVEVLHTGADALICCGQPMKLQEEKTQDEGKEKHVPVIEETESGTKVKVGSVEHLMEENHYIEWIEIRIGDNYARHFLKPRQKPETEFSFKPYEKPIVRIYCNIHGLWKKE